MKLRLSAAAVVLALLCAAGAARAQSSCRNVPPPAGPWVGELGDRGTFRIFSCYTSLPFGIVDDGTLTSLGSIRELRKQGILGPEVCTVVWAGEKPFPKITTTTVTVNYPQDGPSCPGGSAKIQVIVKDTKPPFFGNYPQYSPKDLPYTGGDVTLSEYVSDASAVTGVFAIYEETSKAVPRDSFPLAFSSGTPQGGQWSATWRVPENQKYAPLTYYFTCAARDPGGLRASYNKCGYVNVAARPDREPPTINFSVSPDTLPTMGGNVVGTVQATDNLGVVRVQTWADKPDGTKTGVSFMTKSAGSATSGTWTLTWPLWANGTSAPVSWVLHVTAYDAAGNQVSAARTVVVRQKVELLRPPIRP